MVAHTCNPNTLGDWAGRWRAWSLPVLYGQNNKKKKIPCMCSFSFFRSSSWTTESVLDFSRIQPLNKDHLHYLSVVLGTCGVTAHPFLTAFSALEHYYWLQFLPGILFPLIYMLVASDHPMTCHGHHRVASVAHSPSLFVIYNHVWFSSWIYECVIIDVLPETLYFIPTLVSWSSVCHPIGVHIVEQTSSP